MRVIRMMDNPYGKAERIREGVGTWTSFYRANPTRLAIDYFGFNWLAPFQEILIYMILKFTYSMIIASRGMGKSLLVAVSVCIKSVLYPGIKIVISAGNRGQSVNVIRKITDDLMPKSFNLRNEIEDYSTVVSDPYILFKNGSQVLVATARSSSRSARANWIICDEFVQIKKTVVDAVLRKFKAGARTPPYYMKEEYRDIPKEPNCETYISSAHYKSHWSWEKFKAFFKSMAAGDSYAVVGLPYQLPVMAGYYPKQQIIDEMSESDFDSVAWSMEMDSLFFGESSKAFFSFDDFDRNRVLMQAVYPPEYYEVLGDPKLKAPRKEAGEIRLGGMDIATSGAKNSDSTCICILSLIPTASGQFIRNLVYVETMMGAHTYDQAVRLRQLADDYSLDYVVIDTNGVGIGVYDNLVRPLHDEDRGCTYNPWSCINDATMAERCKAPDAPKMIYSVKANTSFNSAAAILLRDCLRRDKIRLLCSEIDANDHLILNKYYNKLSVEEQVRLKMPFLQTTSLINEAINLDYEVRDNNVRVTEPSTGHKDRYSALSYANYIASELERTILRPKPTINGERLFFMKNPVIKKGGMGYGRR